LGVTHSQRIRGTGRVHEGEWRRSERAWMGTVGFQGTGREAERIYKHSKGKGGGN